MRLFTPRRRWADTVDNAELPAPITETLKDTIRRTRLRPSEKQDLAVELTAHFADGLDANATPDELLASFGDPRQNARLMRRAKKRCRGPIWKAWILTLKTAGALAIGLVLLYGALAALYFTAEPNIDTDYARQLQDRVLAENPPPAKWSAWIDIWGDTPELPPHPGAADDPHADKLFDAGDAWDGIPTEVAAYIEDAQPWLSRARELALADGSLRWPHYTALVPEEYAEMDAERRGDARAVRATLANDPEQSWFAVRFGGYLSDQRRVAAWLGLDAARAAKDSDRQHFIENFEAIVEIGAEAGEMPMLINWLTKVSVRSLAVETVTNAIARHPDLLDRAQIQRLAHAMGKTGFIGEPSLLGERFFVRDYIQRVYSEGGPGGGRLTHEGMRSLGRLAVPVSSAADLASAIADVGGPVRMAIVAGRDETARVYERLMDETVLWADAPPWERGDETPIDRALAENPGFTVRHPMISRLLPVYGQLFTNRDRARFKRDAALVALALAAHRLEHGEWPASLETLVPAYLPRVPRDIHTGEPLRYKRTDDGPLLYSVGPDRTDDGGVWARNAREMKVLVPPGSELRDSLRGDWILFRLGSIEPTPDEPRFDPDRDDR